MIMKIIATLIVSFIIAQSSIYSQNDCKITYVSNEGFLIETNSKKVLIDGLFNKIDGNWCDSPSESLLDSLKNSIPPFDNIDLIAITHNHIDHFNENVVVNHLLSSKKALVICPNQVGDVLAKNPNYKKFSDRIISLTPSMYSDTNIVISEIPIRVLRFEHSHYMEEDSISGEKINRHRNIENLGYLFAIDGITIFHCGDTNPLNEKEYSTYKLQNEEIDIAFLERQFYGKGSAAVEIINKYISPENIIVMHIGPKNKKIFMKYFESIPNVNVLDQKMDSMTFSFAK